MNFQLWLVIFLIPLEVQGHKVPHLKGLKDGKDESSELCCGYTSSICQDVMKCDNLLHKKGFFDSLLQTTLTGLSKHVSSNSAANFCFNKGLCMIWNKGTLSKDKSCEKSCHDLDFQSPKRYESHLSNEVLYTLVDRLRDYKNIWGQSWRLIRNCRLSLIRDWCALKAKVMA